MSNPISLLIPPLINWLKSLRKETLLPTQQDSMEPGTSTVMQYRTQSLNPSPKTLETITKDNTNDTPTILPSTPSSRPKRKIEESEKDYATTVESEDTTLAIAMRRKEPRTTEDTIKEAMEEPVEWKDAENPATPTTLQKKNRVPLQSQTLRTM